MTLTKTDGGCLAYFATLRPRRGISDSDLRRLTDWLPSVAQHWLVVVEKEGEARHAHAAIFPHKPQQRSNICTMLLRNVASQWDDDEKANLRRFDRKSGTGAVKTLTSVELITEYLNGTYATKSDDPFYILSEKLPDDLSELESFIPDVGQLKRAKNVKFHTLLAHLTKHFNWPAKTDPRAQKYTMWDLTLCHASLQNNDHIEFITDPRIRKNHLDAFLEWYHGNDRDVALWKSGDDVYDHIYGSTSYRGTFED